MKLRLFLSGKDLCNIDRFKFINGTSDPYAVVSLSAVGDTSNKTDLGKTEVHRNDLSPHWNKAFEFDYEENSPVQINVTVFDNNKASKDKSMGSATFEVAKFFEDDSESSKTLTNGGIIFARIQKAADVGKVLLRMTGSRLANLDGYMGKSDPFYELQKSIDGKWDTVYRSNIVMDNHHPKWDKVILDLNDLCDGNLDAPINFVVSDYERTGKHEVIGSFQTTVNELVEAEGDPFALEKDGKVSGTIFALEGKFYKTESQE